MVVFEDSVVLPATPARTFAIIGDPDNGPRIDPMITRYEPEGGVMRQGGRNHIRMRAFGIPMHVVSVTREWNPPHRMILENVKPSKPVRMTLTQTFEPHPDGTLLTYHADFEGLAPAAAVFRWLFARNFRRALPRVLAIVRDQAPGR